jgi:hypothetical protein
MNSINIETLMAHSIGISDSYYRATKEEILQDYLKAESYLTINVESELREQLYKMEQASTTTTALESKLSQKESEIVELRQGLDLMSSQMQSVLSILETMKARDKNKFAKELFKKGRQILHFIFVYPYIINGLTQDWWILLNMAWIDIRRLE